MTSTGTSSLVQAAHSPEMNVDTTVPVSNTVAVDVHHTAAHEDSDEEVKS